jgi:hypothetical protein
MSKKRVLLSVATATLFVAFFVVLLHFTHPAFASLPLGLLLLPLLGVTSTSTRFQDTPCKVVVSNNFDTHGTITRASIEHLTPTQLEALFRPSGLFADMDAWFRTAFEMKACGTKVNGMYDWLMSSQKQVGNLLNTEKVDRGPSLLIPFILGRQDSVINTEYWAITQGQAQSAYTATVTGPLTTDDLALGSASDRVIRVVSRYGIDLDPKWFLNRDVIYIWGRASGGQTYRGAWKVLASEVAADLSYVDVLITSQNAGSASVFDATPTSGVVVLGNNNVADWESYCQNRPTLDPRKRVPFWFKTMRRARRVDSEYKKVFARLMESNELFRQFGDLPLSERNRQDEADFQKRWVNDFFWGKPLNANQTLALWKNLPQITSVTGLHVDPGQGGKLVAYRAEMVGIYEQLKACNRTFDLQNNPLNFDEWLDENYRIYRARDSQGRNVSSIDWFTNSPYSALLETAFIAYYRREYGDIVRINVDTGMNDFGFHWRTFTVKFPAGIKLNIVTHKFFDDIRDAANTENIISVGNFLMSLEMGKGGTIYPGMIASNKKMRLLGELEQLARIDPTFACTLEVPTEEISLVSETCTAVCECPANNAIIESIADAVPVTSGRSASYSNLY